MQEVLCGIGMKCGREGGGGGVTESEGRERGEGGRSEREGGGGRGRR